MQGAVAPLIVHASAVSLGRRGVLILGASGGGKSSLALAMIGRGATLVADDRVQLSREGDTLVARAPAGIASAIEVRGIGILRVPSAAEATVTLVVDLNHTPEARMPQIRTITYLGISIELIFGRGIPNLDVALTVYLQNGRAFPE